MTTPARLTPIDSGDAVDAHPHPAPAAPRLPAGPLPGLPVMLNAHDLSPTLPSPMPLRPADGGLKFIDVTGADAPAKPAGLGGRKRPARAGRGADVLRGIQDLQQLQKQTIAVLESVKGALDDIAQVLRSPEATRGMEKQQNAATLLTKGFAREALEQAQGAVALLPANPEAHLLLSLSLAAAGDYDASLAAARKGLALVDRRAHPLAIECGLLHAIAALGRGPEAVDRWAVIIDSLPLPVLFEQLGRIGACFPTDAMGGGPAVLDDLVNTRLVRDEEAARAAGGARRPRGGDGAVGLLPDEIPAGAVFAGLDGAKDFTLTCTHRAILAQIARRVQLVKDAGDAVKFLAECVVPLANRGLDRSAGALGRAAVKRLLAHKADAMTLHRALGKLQMAGATVAARELATLLDHWRRAGSRVRRARRGLQLAALLLAAGAGVLGWVYVGHGLAQYGDRAIWIGPGMIGAGALVGLATLFGRTWQVALPAGRGPLTAEELAYVKTAAVRQDVRGALGR
jgi:hypothetical protein